MHEIWGRERVLAPYVGGTTHHEALASFERTELVLGPTTSTREGKPSTGLRSIVRPLVRKAPATLALALNHSPRTVFDLVANRTAMHRQAFRKG